jgi:signal transduction histidine kinase
MPANTGSPISLIEIHRIQKLQESDILDSGPEPTFDRITQIAREIFDTPEAFLAFVDDTRIFIKSGTNKSNSYQFPSGSGFWRKTFLADQALIYDDLGQIKELSIDSFARAFQSYAGVPLKTQEGYVLGALVVMGRNPFQHTNYKLKILDTLSHLMMEQLAIRVIAKKAFKAHMDLVHQTVHDLKNPLSSILLSADLIVFESEDRTSVRDFSDTIIRNVTRMSDRLDGLLDLSKMEDGSFKLERNPTDLVQLLKTVITTLEMISNKKNQRIHLESPDTFLFNCDADRVEEIFENLISNAIKFSPTDSQIQIRILVQKADVVIIVKDQGQGLNQTDQEKLFTKFAKLSASPTGMESSHGLGLSIVKTLVELHNGKVWAESEGKNRGSSFFVSFPVDVL